MKKVYISMVIFLVIIAGVLIALWHADRTNPYSPHTEMTPAYSAIMNKHGQFILTKQHNVYLKTDLLSTALVKFQAALRIITYAWYPVQPIQGTEDTIIQQIHKERFDPSKAYLISGDHFADFYPRNYGLFYSAVLDPRVQISRKDWDNRQKIMLQTTAFYLDLLNQSKTAFTTYMPLTNTTFVGVNIWSYPSDSLYSVLFQLSALTNDQFITTIIPMNHVSPSYSLQTKVVPFVKTPIYV